MLDPGFQGDGKLTNDLLAQFGRGFPIENLRLLLVSANPYTQGSAAFIATFYDTELQPMVREVAALLDSPENRTRFDAIEALGRCTTKDDGEILGRVFLLLDDPWHGVRWKVVQFISSTAAWQLHLAVKHAALLRPESAFAIIRDRFRLNMNRIGIQRLIDDDDPILRRFGAAMAIRPRHIAILEHIELAAQSTDPDLVEIAESAKQGFLTPRYAVFARRVEFAPPPIKVAKRR